MKCPHPKCGKEMKALPDKLGKYDAFMCDHHGIYILCDCCPEMLDHLGHVTMDGDDEYAELEVACELGSLWSLGQLDMTSLKEDIADGIEDALVKIQEDKE